MTFFNWTMLFGLAAVGIPVLIHLLNRGGGEVVPWGAMRFLLASVASQSRRILLEEALLMATRCLIVMLVVLAMARPFLPSTAGVPWGLILLAVLGAAVCVGVGSALWSRPRARRALFIAVAGLLLAAGTAVLVEQLLQGRRWGFGGESSDIVILIDSSSSMTVERDGRTNFQRAVEEAWNVVKAARPADGIAVFLAGPVPVPLIGKPTSDRKEIRRFLREETPEATGGEMGVLEAMNAAGSALKSGQGASKKIVLITDGQGVGWRTGSKAQWQFVSESFADLPTRPKVVCRRLPLPDKVKNLSVTDIRFSRRVIGTARHVGIDVNVVNTGLERAGAKAIRLLVDGTNVATRTVQSDILPGSSDVMHFTYRFTKPGPHVVSAETDWEDDLPSDNSAARVVRVLDRLPVLIVDGAPSTRPLSSASAFVEIALKPRQEEALSLAARIWGFLRREEATKEPEREGQRDLVAPTVLPAKGVATLDSLDAYDVVILVNVPRLPASFTDKLTDFVRQGGGLLFVPGDRTQQAFFNEWTTPAGEKLLPAQLAARHFDSDTPVRLLPNSLNHPAMTLVAGDGQSDIRSLLIYGFWALETDERDREVRIAGALETGVPLFAERRLEQGHILMSSFMLDRKDSSLPSLKCFVPLIHELVYYLAEPLVPDHNIRPGVGFTVDAVADDPKQLGERPRGARDGPDDSRLVHVVTPSRRERKAEVQYTAHGLRLSFRGTHQPGVYAFHFATNLAPLYSSALLEQGSLPFVVVGSAKESEFRPLGEAELRQVSEHLDLFMADSSAEMTMAVSEEVPGTELWKTLALAALLGLVGEIGLSRWISIKRRYNTRLSVDFGTGTFDVTAFRAQAESLLESRKRAEPGGGDDGHE